MTALSSPSGWPRDCSFRKHASLCLRFPLPTIHIPVHCTFLSSILFPLLVTGDLNPGAVEEFILVMEQVDPLLTVHSQLLAELHSMYGSSLGQRQLHLISLLHAGVEKNMEGLFNVDLGTLF